MISPAARRFTRPGSGIASSTAIFSVIDGVLLHPLPYPDSARLVFVWERLPNLTDPMSSRIQVARKNYLEWKRQNTVFSDMAAFREMRLNESAMDHPRHVSTGFASANLHRAAIRKVYQTSICADGKMFFRDLGVRLGGLPTMGQAKACSKLSLGLLQHRSLDNLFVSLGHDRSIYLS